MSTEAETRSTDENIDEKIAMLFSLVPEDRLPSVEKASNLLQSVNWNVEVCDQTCQ